MNRMHVVVLGAGGVGGYFGAKLARTDARVTFLARGAHLEAIRRDGLHVRSVTDGEWTVKVDAVDDLAGAPAADAVIVAVKSFDTEAALVRARPVVAADTAVVSLQNGVESLEIIERVLGPGHAVGGAAYVFATIERPGVVAHTLLGRIVLGEISGAVTPRVERLRAALERAAIPVQVTADVLRALWEKYLMITAQAGMTALTRRPIGVIRGLPATWAMYRRIVEELAAVGGAAGVKLAPDAVERTLTAAGGLAADAYSSMHYDLTHGKPLELETLHGYAVRLGERLGVPTPTIFAVYAALLPWAPGGRA